MLCTVIFRSCCCTWGNIFCLYTTSWHVHCAYWKLCCCAVCITFIHCAFSTYSFTLFTSSSMSQLSARLGVTASGCHAALLLSWSPCRCCAGLSLSCCLPLSCCLISVIVLCAFHAVLLLSWCFAAVVVLGAFHADLLLPCCFAPVTLLWRHLSASRCLAVLLLP